MTYNVIEKIAIGLAITAIFGLASCSGLFNTDDYNIKKIKAAPTLDLPLVYGSLGIQDILSKTDQAIVKVYSDGLVYLQYDQTLKSQGITGLFNFPNKSFTIPPIPVPPSTLPARAVEVQYASFNTVEDFAFSPEKLSEIKFKSTTLRITVAFNPVNPASGTFEVQVRLPDFTLNGVVFQKRITAGAAGVVFSLKDYVATLSNNTFPLEIAIFEKPHSSPITITNPTSVTVRLDYTTLDFQYLKGFFGDQTALNIPAETIDFNAFGNSLSKAKVSFADPKFSFTVSNDYGIPTKVTFNPLEVRKKNGTKLNVLLSPASPVSINVPLQLGQSANTAVSILNAKQMADFAPDQLYYKITARINEGLTSGNNFCADTSKMRVNFKAEIPIYGKASDIVLADTFAIDLSSTKSSTIESGSVLTKVTNELPLDAFIQLYLANDQTIIFDSLFTTAQTAIVKASTVNAQGELQSPSVLIQEIQITKEKLDKIFTAKKLIIKARANTVKDSNGNQPDVKFKAAYKMSVNFGLKAKLKLEYDL